MRSLPTPSPALPHRSPGVVIDWSEGEMSVETLLGWVNSYPERRAIHIVLPAKRHITSGRKLQSRLQTLGCTVTLRRPLS